MEGAKSDLESFLPWGLIALYKYEKLGLRAKKYLFIRFLNCSKYFVTFGEHLNIMTKVKSGDVDFLENKFLSMDELKKET